MKLCMRQHVFTWGDRFTIYDDSGNDRYYVEGEVFTFGKKLHLTDTAGRELAYIHQEILSFLPRYYININGVEVAEVVRELAFFEQRYTVERLGWSVVGDFLAHDYSVCSPSGDIATVAKEWFTFGDMYGIDIAPGADIVTVLAVVLVIDACIESSRSR